MYAIELKLITVYKGVSFITMELYIYKAIARVRNIVKLARCRDVANLDIWRTQLCRTEGDRQGL
jgi:hypothetical protein